MSLADALSDLKQEVIAGGSVDELADDIAADYGLNPQLLRRKFAESYPNPELLAASAAATSAQAHAARVTEEAIEQALRMYRVTREHLWECYYSGSDDLRGRFTIIGRTSPGYNLGIRHEDGSAWRLPANFCQRI